MENIIKYTVNKNFSDDLYLSVQNGEVVIKAPWYYTNNQIQNIIKEKRNWIINKLKELYDNLSNRVRSKERTRIHKKRNCKIIWRRLQSKNKL